MRAALAARRQRGRGDARRRRRAWLRRPARRQPLRRRTAEGADRPRPDRRPRLLLLDEPLANLDLRSGHEVVALLSRIAREQRIAILISAHDMNPLLRGDGPRRLPGGRAGRQRHGRGGRAHPVLSELYGHHVDVAARPRSRPGRGRRGGRARRHRRPEHTHAQVEVIGEPTLRGHLRAGILHQRAVRDRGARSGRRRRSGCGCVGVFTVIRGSPSPARRSATSARPAVGRVPGRRRPLWGFAACAIAAAA